MCVRLLLTSLRCDRRGSSWLNGPIHKLIPHILLSALLSLGLLLEEVGEEKEPQYTKEDQQLDDIEYPEGLTPRHTP